MLVKHPFYQNSECRNGYLHRFNIKEEYSEGVKEVCEICGMSKFFRVIEGRVNNAEYMSYHFKQVLPPFHPLYPRQMGVSDEIISPYI